MVSIDGAANLRRDDIMGALSRADETAREHGEDLLERFPDWAAEVSFLSSDECPVTYLPVLTVMLIARSIREKSELDVLDIQQGSSSRGYSASSIAGHLIKFVTQVGIDLRTTSSQVMNSQPFTYKKRVLFDMAGDRVKASYAQFFAAAERVELLDSATAAEVLALVFHMRRGASKPETEHLVITGDRRTLIAIMDATTEFVSTNSEAGKVGQAFAAALFDILFPSNSVRMGNNNDPSATIPGDVQVGSDGRFWLWAEVKQKAVVTSEIQAFVDRVKAIGGDRAMYFALGNALYPQNIDAAQLQKRAIKDGIELTVYSAVEQALEDLLPKSPGSAGMQAEALANRLLNRLQEAQVTSALEEAWAAAIRSADS
jgi:SacI restriction endonuclease